MSFDRSLLPPALVAMPTYPLSILGRDARRLAADRLASIGLRLGHAAVLAAVADFGPCAQRALADRLDVHPSDMVELVEQLTTAGLVRRERDEADRRRYVVRLSEAGRAALARAQALTEQAADDALALLDDADRARLVELARRALGGDAAPATGAGTGRSDCADG